MNAVIVTALLAVSAGPTELEKAYLKELAFLKAEKSALTGRLAEQTARSAKRLQEQESSLATLQARLRSLRSQTQTTESKLARAEAAPAASEGFARLRDTLVRAQESAGPDAVKLDVEAGPDDLALALRTTTSLRIKTLADSSRLRRTSGSFFLQDGTKVEGDLIFLGEVMAWGIAPEGTGALAPAGAGRYRLWPAPAKVTAEGWLAKAPPATIRGLVFEPTDQSVDPDKQRTVVDELQAGGFIAWNIAGLGALAFALIVWRGVALSIAAAQIRKVVEPVSRLVATGKATQALHLTETQRGPASRVLQAALRFRGRPRQDVDDAVDEALLAEAPGLERFGTAIVVFAAVAPLLGLLGTVTGMISTFDVITEFGTGDPRMLSGGISEALITTKLGLLVAIPSLLAGTLLSSRADRMMADLDHAALSLTNSLRGLDASPPAPPTKAAETGDRQAPVLAPLETV